MQTYLVIITTALVLTQIIRVIQNAIQLRRLKKSKSRENEIYAMWKKLCDSVNKLTEEVKKP